MDDTIIALLAITAVLLAIALHELFTRDDRDTCLVIVLASGGIWAVTAWGKGNQHLSIALVVLFTPVLSSIAGYGIRNLRFPGDTDIVMELFPEGAIECWRLSRIQ